MASGVRRSRRGQQSFQRALWGRKTADRRTHRAGHLPQRRGGQTPRPKRERRLLGESLTEPRARVRVSPAAGGQVLPAPGGPQPDPAGERRSELRARFHGAGPAPLCVEVDRTPLGSWGPKRAAGRDHDHLHRDESHDRADQRLHPGLPSGSGRFTRPSEGGGPSGRRGRARWGSDQRFGPKHPHRGRFRSTCPIRPRRNGPRRRGQVLDRRGQVLDRRFEPNLDRRGGRGRLFDHRGRSRPARSGLVRDRFGARHHRSGGAIHPERSRRPVERGKLDAHRRFQLGGDVHPFAVEPFHQPAARGFGRRPLPFAARLSRQPLEPPQLLEHFSIGLGHRPAGAHSTRGRSSPETGAPSGRHRKPWAGRGTLGRAPRRRG